MTFARFSADSLKINEKGSVKKVRETLKQQMRVAARLFIKAAIVRIPVDSGMARGAFLDLGRALGVKVPIVPKRTDQVYQFSPARGSLKSPTLGASLMLVNGKPSQSVSFKNAIQMKGSKASFRVRANIFHLILNDIYGYRGTGPWQAFAAGRNAFVEHMNTKAARRMPTLEEMTVKSIVRVDKNSITRTPFRASTKDRVVKRTIFSDEDFAARDRERRSGQ